jgi:anti-sigma factor RsiW
MKHVQNLIQKYLAGELDPDRTAAVDKHLAECSRCRQEADGARALWGLIDSAAHVPVGSRNLWPAVRARALGRDAERRQWFFGDRPWIRGGLAFTALAAGLMVGLLVPAGSDEESLIAGIQGSSSWPEEAAWLMDSSWLTTEGTSGLDEVLLGVGLSDEGNGS